MKILKSNLMKVPAVLLLSTAIFITSCKDDKPNDPAAQEASIKVINGVKGTGEYLVTANTKKVSETALTYRKSLPYSPLNAGKTEFIITEKATGTEVSRSTVELEARSAASVYLVREAASVRLVTVKDDLTLPGAKKAKIRFVNMNNNAGNLSITVLGQPVPLFNSTPFKGFTPFIEVTPANDFTFVVKKDGQPDALVTLPNTTIEAGRIYTLWATEDERVASTDVALGLITNK